MTFFPSPSCEISLTDSPIYRNPLMSGWNFWETSTWLHVVVSVNETGFMKMYRNGNLSSSSQGQVPNSVTRNYHYIGKSTYSGWANFHGTIG